MNDNGQIRLGFVEEDGRQSASVILEELGIAIRFIEDPAQATAAISELADARLLLGLDIETEKLEAYRDHPAAGLDPHLSRIRLIQLYGPRNKVFVFDLRQIELTLFRKLWDKPMVAHKAVFELGHMLHAGIAPRRLGCTLLQANALGSRMQSLADLCEHEFGCKISKRLQTSDWSTETLSGEQIAYAALDAVAVALIAEKQHARLRNRGLLDCYRIMRDTQRAVARMMLNGVYFDRSGHAPLIAAWKRSLAQAERKLSKLLGTGVNAASGKQLSDWLEEHLDSETLRTWPRSRSGRLRTNSAALSRNRSHPIVAPLLAHREAATRLSAFGPSLAAHISPATGRIHAQFRLGAAASGRMACFDPNLQNIPREPTFRSLFRAPPGRLLVVADYAQIELRVAAQMSGDPAMLGAYERGDDLHLMTAAAVTGLPLEQVNSEQRRLAKAVNFGLLYGQGARGLASYARHSYGVAMDEQQATRAREAFFASYPTLAEWQRSTAREAERKMRVVTPSGRVFDFNDSRRGYSYPEALNIPIQGGAAEVLMAALTHLDRGLEDLDAKLVNVIHDEVVVESSADAAPDVKTVVEESMAAGMLDIFAEAPTRGLVQAQIAEDWSQAK